MTGTGKRPVGSSSQVGNTIWQFHIAIEHGPFEFAIKKGDFP
jgi:hypothetical protein